MPRSKAVGKHVVLIGAGRMGSAMAAGWLRDPASAGIASLDLVEPNPAESVARLAARKSVRLNPKPSIADVVVLAVKPQQIAATAPAIAPWTGPETLIVSILAGVTISRLSELLGVSRIVRAMPNTPGSIGAGVTAFSLSSACSDAESAIAVQFLQPLGRVIGPLDERKMDAVTAVSGSGPAYVFLLTEALAAAGRSMGLDSETAEALAVETVVGGGKLLAEGGAPSDLRKAVTSPGGTTAAALDVLMGQGGLPELMRRAVEAATKRGAELSRDS
ncbi:MAG: pyrroline-5-carboxylate reductase [Alphaproteobacteria bacterium]|nr:pyrroline-5-carboxylate reductase [Alphaproteobacteria bacterium]